MRRGDWRLLPRAEIEVLDGARHHLANESGAIRETEDGVIIEIPVVAGIPIPG